MFATGKGMMEECESSPALCVEAVPAEIDHALASVRARTTLTTITGELSPETTAPQTSRVLSKLSAYLRRINFSRGIAQHVSIGRHQLRLDEGTSDENAIATVEE